jgi:hypothetical protein
MVDTEHIKPPIDSPIELLAELESMFAENFNPPTIDAKADFNSKNDYFLHCSSKIYQS